MLGHRMIEESVVYGLANAALDEYSMVELAGVDSNGHLLFDPCSDAARAYGWIDKAYASDENVAVYTAGLFRAIVHSGSSAITAGDNLEAAASGQGKKAGATGNFLGIALHSASAGEHTCFLLDQRTVS